MRTKAGHHAIDASAATGFVAVVLLAATAWSSQMSPADRSMGASQPVSATGLVRACGDKGGEEKYACYEQGVLRSLATSGLETTLDILSVAGALDREVQRDGHVYAHAIGMAAYAAYDGEKNVGRTFRRCSEVFQSGCYHGVIQAYLEEMLDPSTAEDTARLNGLCQTYRNNPFSRWLLFQCVHALGHGLTTYYGHDLPRALKGCDALLEAWDRHSCYGGAFMENVVQATRPHQPTHRPKAVHSARHGRPAHATFRPMDPTDLHHPCSILAEQYLSDCYQMQTSIILYYNHGDIAAAAQVCNEAPPGMRTWCYQSLGRDISSYTVQQPDEAVRLCALGDPTYQPWCYVGLVKNFIDLTAKSESGLVLCPRIPGEANRMKCYEAVGEEIWALTSDDTQRAALCSQVDGEEEQACRYGARLRLEPPPAIPVAGR